MNKYLSYLSVGLLSACIALAGNFVLNKKENDPTKNKEITTSAKQDSRYFQNASFNGISNNLEDFTFASEKSVNAVVSIKRYSSNQSSQNNPFDQFFFGFPQQRQDKNSPSGLGSGVIISEDGYIVTNNHVIEGSDRIEVVLNDQTSFDAQLIGTDPNTDIALLKIEGSSLSFLKFINSDVVKVGEWVLAVGNPFGLNSTVTAGIISAKARSINILSRSGDNPIESFIQTDAAINPGNSGGALVNSNGDLVGINTAISSQTGSYVGYGFAVPANLVKKIVEDLKKYGIIQRGYIGINGLDLSDEEQVRRYNEQNNKKEKTRQGVLVTELSENGGAKISGIQKGDILISVNGKEIKNFSALSLAVGSKRPGDKVEVKLIRDKKEIILFVVLRDINGGTKIRSKGDLTVAEKLGGTFLELSEKQKVSFGIQKGVLVSGIKTSGKLNSIGIRDNYIILEINGKDVDSTKDVEKILKDHTGNVSVSYVDNYGRIYKRGFKLN